MLSIGAAYAQPSVTVGLGYNQGVFAAEGLEQNFDESGTIRTTTKEYGAFEDSFGSLYVEMNSDVGSIGLSIQSDISTPTNVQEANHNRGSGTLTASSVSADFEEVFTLYGLINLPVGGAYVKAGIVQGDIVINEKQRSGNQYADQDLEGYVLGFGVQKEAAAANLRFELLGHTYDDVSSTNGVATTGNHNKVTNSDMIGSMSKISVNKTF